MSPQLLADALAAARRHNRLPRAVVVVDLYGQCADYDEIVPLCHELGIAVVEDAAEALGSTYKGRPAGTLGDIGVFSFNGNKIVTTSGGGMLVTASPSIADRARYLSTQAREPAEHYEHAEVGFNYRLSNLLAAVGRAQLVRLPELTARRLAISARYRQRLADVLGVTFMPVAPWGGWNGWLTCVLFDVQQQRNRVRSRLAAHDIESRPLWKPMHLQPMFKDRSAVIDGTSERLFERGLCLPSGSAMDLDTVDRLSQVACGNVTVRP
jgi:dTDP-4-amino-4,6-dideoxygalactose transaminase